ncbi:MAG TPA: SRPBCC family protein [Verrucomicrobiae bacterium]
MSSSVQPKPQAKVQRHFNVPAERVFSAWLDPLQIGHWMFGPTIRDEEIISLKTSPKVGGKFSFIVNRQGKQFDHVGEYLEIQRPTRLVFTWAVTQVGGEPSKVIIDITPMEEGCELALIHEMAPEWADFVVRSEEAWSKMLAALAKTL